jgi:hypothetical protein
MYNRKVCGACKASEEFLIDLVRQFGQKGHAQAVVRKIKKFLKDEKGISARITR